MTRQTWVVVFEGQGAPEPGTRKLVDRLLALAFEKGDLPDLEWVGVPATKVSEARAARPELIARLAALRPERILVLGALALLAIRGDKAKPTLASERGRLQWALAGEWQAEAVLLMPTLPGTWARADGEYVRDIGRDVLKWATQDRPIEVAWPDYHQPATQAKLTAALGLLKPYAIVSLDVETTGLDARRDDLLCVGIGTTDGPVIVVDRDLLAQAGTADQLWNALMADPLMRVVLHNGKFDLEFLARLWETVPDGTGARFGDTQLLSYLLDERPVRSKYRAHGLKDLSRVRFDVADYGMDHDLFQARLAQRPLDPDDPASVPPPLEPEDWEDFHAYQAMDCRMTALLWEELVAEAAEESPMLLACHDNLLIPASLALTAMELEGLPVDRALLEREKARLERKLDRRKVTLQRALGIPDFNPGSAKQFAAVIKAFPVLPPKPTEINRASSSYVKYAWTTKGVGEPIPANEPIYWPRIWKGPRHKFGNETPTSVGEIRILLNEFLLRGRKREARIMDMVLNWRLDAKYLKTYVDGFLAAIGPDGRIHASFNIGGSVTGRLSSSGPNLHAIPKRGAGTILTVRRTIAASPGHLLLEADYSQLELRVAAMLSGDERMREAYEQKKDLHREVASTMFRKPPEDVSYQERFMAKAVDFGILYGRSGKAISESDEMYYFETYLGGTPWTPAEADHFVRVFLEGYPRLRDWMKRQADEVLVSRLVETVFGRRRRFHLAFKDVRSVSTLRRQAVNSPVQGVASDICLSALVRLWERLDPAEARPVSIVHDSILLEVREDAVERLAPVIRTTMQESPIISDIPWAVDLKVGRTLSDTDMKELP